MRLPTFAAIAAISVFLTTNAFSEVENTEMAEEVYGMKEALEDERAQFDGTSNWPRLTSQQIQRLNQINDIAIRDNLDGLLDAMEELGTVNAQAAPIREEIVRQLAPLYTFYGMGNFCRENRIAFSEDDVNALSDKLEIELLEVDATGIEANVLWVSMQRSVDINASRWTVQDCHQARSAIVSMMPEIFSRSRAPNPF